jgi:hypothetical protein
MARRRPPTRSLFARPVADDDRRMSRGEGLIIAAAIAAWCWVYGPKAVGVLMGLLS